MSIITGLSLANVLGATTDAVWAKVAQGSAAVLGHSYPTPDHDAIGRSLASRTQLQCDPTTHIALHLADRLMEQVPKPQSPFDTGVMLGNTFGGMTFGQRELSNLYQKGPQAVSPYQSFAWFFAANTGQVSIRHDLKGPCGTVAAEACGGIDAIAQAHRLVVEGQPRMLTGAVDGSAAPFGVAVQYAHADATRSSEAYAPLTTEGAGFVPGEGGALLLIEDEPTVRAQSRSAIARIAGHASGFIGSDADPAATIASVLRGALADSKVEAQEVGLVFADGIGSPGADKDESDALAKVFGAESVPVTVPKASFGRLGAAASATDVALAALAIQQRLMPPTPMPVSARPLAGVDIVHTPAPLERPTVAVVSRGFGGFVSALVLTCAD